MPAVPLSLLPIVDSGPPSRTVGTPLLADKFEMEDSLRYAAGRVITPVACGALFAQAYFVPGVMEVFEQLVYSENTVPYTVKISHSQLSELGTRDWSAVFTMLIAVYSGQV